MTEIILSIIVILGLAGGPSETPGCAPTDDSPAVSQNVNQ